MSNPLIVLAGSLFLAFIVESVVEYLLGVPMDHSEKLKEHKWVLQYVAVLVGVFACFWYKVDLVALVFEQAPTELGIVFTGLLVSRGADWLHKNVLVVFFKGKAEARS